MYKIEKTMVSEGCVRIMFSVPSTRNSVSLWFENQGFGQVSSISYPAAYLKHELLDSAKEINLNLYSKSLLLPELPLDDASQPKESHASTVPLPPLDRNLHLPPHWRGIASTSATSIFKNSDEVIVPYID